MSFSLRPAFLVLFWRPGGPGGPGGGPGVGGAGVGEGRGEAGGGGLVVGVGKVLVFWAGARAGRAVKGLWVFVLYFSYQTPPAHTLAMWFCRLSILEKPLPHLLHLKVPMCPPLCVSMDFWEVDLKPQSAQSELSLMFLWATLSSLAVEEGEMVGPRAGRGEGAGA